MEPINPLTATSAADKRVYTVDAEHGRLRLVVVLVFLTATAVGYFVINGLVPSDGLNIVAIVGAFAVAYGITAILEQALKRRWPSGRSVEVDASGVRMIQNGKVQQNIQAGKPTTTLMWRFQTKRRSRVPKGWYLLACALEQDDASVSIYTLISPDQFKNYSPGEQFKALKAKTDVTAPTGRSGRDDLLLAGEQRRLLQAENQRWQTGAEMTFDDFKAYVADVEARFAEQADVV